MSVLALQGELSALIRLVEATPSATLGERCLRAEGTLRRMLAGSEATTVERALRSLGQAVTGVEECTTSTSDCTRALAAYRDSL